MIRLAQSAFLAVAARITGGPALLHERRAQAAEPSAMFRSPAPIFQTPEKLGNYGAWQRQIVTRVEPFEGFYLTETYHQDHLTLHPESACIRRNDLPKVAALRSTFPGLYRSGPALVSGTGTISAQDR